jgi:hypothetical protein
MANNSIELVDATHAKRQWYAQTVRAIENG